MAEYQCGNCGNRFVLPDWLDTGISCPKCRTLASRTAGVEKKAPAARLASGLEQNPTPPKIGASDLSPGSRPPIRGLPAKQVGAANTTVVTHAVTPTSASVPAMSHFKTRSGFSLRRLVMGRNKFVVFGAIGAIGGAIGAALGELLLWLTYLPIPQPPAVVQTQPNAVCLLIDTSGSMGGQFWSSKLNEVKEAATKFAAAQDLKRSRIAVVGFGSTAYVETPAADQFPAVEQAIKRLSVDGGTNMSDGIDLAADQLHNQEGRRSLLLFTDGLPDSQEATLEAAHRARNAGCQIVAIGTEDADRRFLERVTGDPTRVIATSAGSFGASFVEAAEKIYGRSLVESAPSAGGFRADLLRTAGWTALLAAGISLALVVGQNLYLGRLWLNFAQGSGSLFGGLATGFVAGGAGQLLFAPVANVAWLQGLGTVLGWGVLGALVGRGMVYFVPNLATKRAQFGGAIGGTIGAVAWLAVSGTLNDVWARLAGAAVLGLVLGLLIVIVEKVFREAWLEIIYGPSESVTVNLGAIPVAVGGDSKACSVFAMGAPAVALRYRHINGRIECEDVIGEHTATVSFGDERRVGNIKVKVCGTA